MEIYNLDYIKEKWKNKLNNMKDGETFNLFIDNPFCKEKCSFCIYSSENIKNLKDDEYNKYYSEYLPNQLKEFKDILSMRIPDTIYFGGGTSSLMTPKIMENIFGLIPNFDKIQNKVFENNPMSTNKKKIEILGKHKFSYLSFGVQTFNNNILEKNHRMKLNEEKLKEVIEYAKQCNMKVNTDLLVYIDKGDIEDLSQFEYDMSNLIQNYNPDIITVYPKYESIKCNFYGEEPVYHSMADSIEAYILISNLRKKLIDFENKYPEYHVAYKENDILSLDNNVLLKNPLTNYYLIKMSDDEFLKTKVYSSSMFPHNPEKQNVLAFGGFGQRAPYSYHGKGYFKYLTKNENWKPVYINTLRI